MLARALLFVAGFSISAIGAAAEPFQPTGKWIVDFADAQCIATRNYGTVEDPLFLVLKAPVTGDVLQLAVVRNGTKYDAWQLEGEISFDDGQVIRASVLDFGVKKLGQRALMLNLPARDLTSMRQATSLRIRVRDAGISKLGTRLGVGATSAGYSFVLTQMAVLLKTLDTCTADLRNIWKVWDYEKGGAGLKQGPMGDLQGIFSGDDYPDIAQFKGQMGIVAFVLLIDEQGKVADCTVTQTSGVAALDAQSCAIVKERGKFKPAIGLDGKPAKSSYFQRINWRLLG
jgi:TonB family protein